MAHNILITGASGYLGGTLLNRWKDANLAGYDRLFALVRKPEQADLVQSLYGATPLTFSPDDEAAVTEAVISNRITIVYFLIGAYYATSQVNFIKALAEVKKRTGLTVHFLYTSGTKQFSSHAGAPTDRPLSDTDPDLYAIHKAQKTPVAEFQESVKTNITVIDAGEEHGVRTYIFSPCIVYGKGEGFGNKISIQTVDIVTAAQSTGRVYRFSNDQPRWPVCHIQDTTSLYLYLLKAMLEDKNPDYGKNGFYLASSGLMSWDDIYHAMAVALAKRGVVHDTEVSFVDEGALAKMAEALGVSEAHVEGKIAGTSTFTPEHAKKLGWVPQFPPQHILEAADAEVDFILQNLTESHRGIR